MLVVLCRRRHNWVLAASDNSWSIYGGLRDVVISTIKQTMLEGCQASKVARSLKPCYATEKSAIGLPKKRQEQTCDLVRFECSTPVILRRVFPTPRSKHVAPYGGGTHPADKLRRSSLLETECHPRIGPNSPIAFRDAFRSRLNSGDKVCVASKLSLGHPGCCYL
jgi:hypothetical protein